MSTRPDKGSRCICRIASSIDLLWDLLLPCLSEKNLCLPLTAVFDGIGIALWHHEHAARGHAEESAMDPHIDSTFEDDEGLQWSKQTGL